MKRVFLASVITLIGSTAMAEGVLGNFVSAGIGFPSYDDLTYDSGLIYNVEANYFITPQAYAIVGYENETISDTEGTATSTVSSGGLKFGGGFEQVLQGSQKQKSSFFGEVVYGQLNMTVELETDTDLDTETFSGSSLVFTGGIRSQLNMLYSEVALNYVTYNSDEIESDNDLNISAMIAFEVTPAFLIGASSIIDLDFEYSSVGVLGTFRF